MSNQKYRNRHTWAKWFDKPTRFDSKKEAARAIELQIARDQGLVSDLERQVKFDLHAEGGAKITTYRADFRYVDNRNKCVIIEDVKGVRTPMYRLKKKWLKLEHGLDILET